MDRLLVKKLCVLAWAVAHMEAETIPVAVRIWLALRYARGDVAQSEQLKPRKRKLTRKGQVQLSLGLFDE